MLARLEAMLAGDGAETEDFFHANRSILVAALGTEAMQLERDLANFDFQRALATVRSLAPPPDFSAARLLMVEDVATNREVLRDMLEAMGLKVDGAEDGEVGVRMAGDVAYDLILMDMLMPVMDGLAATTAIRRLPGHTKTPIVALTGNAFNGDRERCLAAGMDDFLGKPVRPERLHAVLSKWLGKSGLARTLPSQFDKVLPPPGDDIKVDVVKLANRLADIPGMDMTECPSLRAHPERHTRYLVGYASAQGGSMALLRERLATDREEARRLAHSLRGVSAQLGLASMGHQAADLEDAIKNGADDDTVLTMAEEAERSLAAVCAAIQTLNE
jgi:two-component system sensor histidine kinase/response regulator